MTDRRLDVALAERGLARSRTHAASLIAAGAVTVGGAVVRKPSARVDDRAEIAVTAQDRYVSRAAHKLIAALDAFPVPVDGRRVLDVGASTGGFTQVLLERGARQVLAIDVGHGQLAAELADDVRVVNAEGVNARYLTPQMLTEATGVVGAVDLVVGDISFISLTRIVPALAATVSPNADWVLLIKPQFEVGRQNVPGGIVRDPQAAHDAVVRVLEAAWKVDYGTAGLLPSPIRGEHGNREYLAWLSNTRGSNPREWWGQVRSMVGA